MTKQGEDPEYLNLDYWNRRWHKEEIQWHREDVSPTLVKYVRLLDGGKKDLKIFVPLCGKSVDMKWLIDLGHRVVGVEICQTALEDFFKEHSMEYTVETKNGIPVLTDKSGRLTLCCCNILDFQKSGEESFDAVWDRGSFGAMNSGERASYVDLLTSLKTQNAVQLLEVYEYDDQLYKESPFSISPSKVLACWGERHDVKLVDSYVTAELSVLIELEPNSCKKYIYLLNLK